MLTIVDLPQPEGPSSAVSLPGVISKRQVLNDLLTFPLVAKSLGDVFQLDTALARRDVACELDCSGLRLWRVRLAERRSSVCVPLLQHDQSRHRSAQNILRHGMT